MGGYGSGRYGWRAKVEDGLVLDLNDLIRKRIVQPHCWRVGRIVWTRCMDGSETGSVGYEAELSRPYGAWIRLHYTTTTWSGEKYQRDYRVYLTTTVPPFGGLRWWFICPLTAATVAKLYLPPGAEKFASRQAYRLAYRSQSETWHGRALEKAQDIRRKLGGPEYMDVTGPFPPKPKGMHWKTYDQLRAKAEHAQDLSMLGLWQMLGRWRARGRRGRGGA